VAKRDAGAATPAKYFFVSKESLQDAEALFIGINVIAGHTMKQRLFQMEIIK
jgi:hypothetical protein